MHEFAKEAELVCCGRVVLTFLKLTSPSCVKFLLCLLLWKFLLWLSKCAGLQRELNPARRRRKIMLIETCKCPGGRIAIYKPYGCVPLMLKGKGFSVPVAHSHPAPYRVTPPLPHTLEDIHQIPYTMYKRRGLQHQPDDVIA